MLQLISNLPSDLANILHGYSCEQDTIGESPAQVYRFCKSKNVYYLKIESTNGLIKREHEILSWLNGKLPVPKIKYWHEQDDLFYLMMTEAPGQTALNFVNDKLREPYENTIKALAEGLLMLQSIDISNCPFHNTLDMKLTHALCNIQNDSIDMEDWEERTRCATPMDLYHWLVANKPNEELCFTHDDYTPENIFTKDKKLTCIIDVGGCGIADKWKDIALCIRSINIHLGYTRQEEDNKHVQLLFKYLCVAPDWNKIKYYTLLDELF